MSTRSSKYEPNRGATQVERRSKAQLRQESRCRNKAKQMSMNIRKVPSEDSYWLIDEAHGGQVVDWDGTEVKGLTLEKLEEWLAEEWEARG